jgi:ferric-dicitrate binding protein FerR (iron transport regulator)
MDYRNYKVEDFAVDDLFVKWVLEDDPDARRFWINYFSENPEVRPVAEQARILVLNLVRTNQPSHSDEQLKRIWEKIENGGALETRNRPGYWVFKFAAGLAILVLVSFGIWTRYLVDPILISNGPKPPLTDDAYTTQFNNTGYPLSILLSEGSEITLEDQSQLIYKRNYTGDPIREVYLNGEAFFTITRNPKQPFFVYANEVVTKVLGTSFRVKTYAHERNILVAVAEGKVSVYSTKEAESKENSLQQEVNGVVLTSNQQVLYSRSDDAFNKSLVEAPKAIQENNQALNFAFQNSSIGEVFKTLEKGYGVEIIFSEETMENCFITVSLQDEPLFEKLKIICRTIGATYEVIDAKIVINSKGCGQVLNDLTDN